jgi:multiple sugar transport system permease protein
MLGRRVWAGLAVFVGFVLTLCVFSGCARVLAESGNTNSGTKRPAKRDVVVWGIATGPDLKRFEGMIDAFNQRHPEINLRVLSMGAGGMNNQKLMTSIVGNVAPDVVYQDRFEVSDWASRGAFRPLDDLIERDKNDPLAPKKSQYYDAPWAEASYGGKIYGIPGDADNRVLYYNKDIFAQRADALRKAGLDPNRAPRTWSELLAYSKVLTDFNPDGTLKRAGFMPNFGNSWLYMYAFMNNAYFISPDGKKCTLDTPESEEALAYMRKGYDVLGGYQNAKNFESGFQQREFDAFIVGKVAMKIDGDWIDDDLSRYAPKMDYGTAAAPSPDDRYYHRGRFANEKDTFITWVGGFAYVIPRGARNIQDAWEFIKFATSTEGRIIGDRAQARWNQAKGRTFIPRQSASKEANELQFKLFRPADERYAGSVRTHIDLMPFGRVRPPTFVSNLLWQEQVKVVDNALYGKMSIKAALTQAQENVQRDLDAFYEQDKFPVVDLGLARAVGIGLGVVTAGVLFWLFKRQRLGRLARTEAVWAYLFVSPWVIGFVVFTLGPMVASLIFSFTQWNVLSPARFVGFKNYTDMVGPDWPNIQKSFSNAAYLAGFGVPLGLMTGLAVALLLNSAVRGMRFYRTCFYMPAIVPIVAATVLWNWLLASDPHKGLINAAWSMTISPWLHTPLPGWVSAEEWAKPSLIMMGVWGAGSGMVLWLAGLKGVPTTLYEAAGIDGASPRQQFWNVTMPMLSSVVFFNIVMGFIGALQEFDRVFILKSNDGPVGPADSLLVPVYHLFDNGFAFFKMGYASALAWVIFAVILSLTLIQFKLAPRWVHYEVDK